MARLAIIIVALGIIAGCNTTPAPSTAPGGVLVPEDLPGRQLSEIVQTYGLDLYHSWDEMNQPPGADAGKTYFFPQGNLYIHYSGDPAIVKSAKFQPAPGTADERYKQANDAWDEYVVEHTLPIPTSKGNTSTAPVR